MNLIAAAAIRGAPVKTPKHNKRRLRLLAAIVDGVTSRFPRDRVCALLLPAGFFKLDLQLGALRYKSRARELDKSELGIAVTALAAKAAEKGCGPLVIGVDTMAYDGFGGDQLVVAWGSGGVLALARKVFPSVIDTSGEEKPPYVVFEGDADDPMRILTLATGERALLGVCYDAFGWVDCALGGTSKRLATEFLADPAIGWRYATSSELDALTRAQSTLIASERLIGLVAIHGFERPGRDVYWQRHGIAAASAALGGQLVVGAAHYKHLPPVHLLDRGTLATRGAPKAHLRQGLRRPARYAPAATMFGVAEPHGLAAVVRIFVA